MAWDRRFSSPWLVHIIALLLPCWAAYLRVEFLGALGMNSPYMTFYPAVMLAALLAGFPAGLLATVLSAGLTSYFWIEPLGSLLVAASADRLGMAIFLVTGAIISLITELMHRAQTRSNQAEARVRLAAEREQASAALQEERNFLRQVIDAFPSSIFVKDDLGNLRLVNEAMAEFYGTTVKEMEGKRIYDYGFLPEEIESRFSREDCGVLHSGKGMRSEAQLSDANGKLHRIETAKSPLFNKDGSSDKLLVVTTDITERKMAEEALYENRELLNSIISGTPDAIYVKDTGGKYLLMNSATLEIMGRNASEVLARDDSEIFPEQDVQGIMRGDRSVMAAQAVDIFEDTFVDARGRSRIYLSTKGPLFDKHGNLSGIFGISRDVSEQKQAEKEFRDLNDELDKRVAERTAQLEAAIKEQESFSYSVSHDLRSPLRHINSYASILVEELGDGISAEARDNLDRICRASKKMGKLIDDLLELARTSRIPLTEEAIDLSRLATISSLLLQQTDKARRVEFNIAEGLQVLGDKTLLKIVVENLLNNAWKYTLQEKVALIEVGAEIMEGEVVFFVSDNGTGFDMEYKDKLFGAFQRLHGSEFEGNGIGLATVKRAIERHGGTIWAEGEVGSGATFYFTLGKETVSYPRQLRQNMA
jgi:PAS domain S-box-containing protein